MTFGEHVFLYCERGNNSELLAEPFNAISNAAFLLAGLIGLQLALWRPKEQRDADHVLLPVLVLFIGLGSLLFHLYADRGTALADVVPISVFTLVYLGFAFNRLLGVPPGCSVLLLIGFAGIMALTGQVQCTDNAIGFFDMEAQGVRPCLNGSIFYLPALAATIVIGLVLHERGHRAAPWVLWAAAIFAVSLTLRTLDLALCDRIVIDGRKVGTHFAWHMLNALALLLLLRASLEGRPAEVAAAAGKPASISEEAASETRGDQEPAPAPEPAEPLAARTEAEAKESEAPEPEAPKTEGERPEAKEEKPKVFFPA
ncbi:MAG TPA: ceramidase domain-containing protein [Methyloceanibacter sp.]|nr:ceramidase domain-containing protein [Methyloceanibacter sp.]